MKDVRLWHGGKPGLVIGDQLMPGHARQHHDGCPFCEARANGEALAGIDPASARHAVYVTSSMGQDLRTPTRTITAKARLGLVTVSDAEYQIVDIGMRMLEPHELLRAQFGRFAADYDLSAATTKSAKVRLIGNSVCPEVAEAVVLANMGEVERVAA